MTVLEQQPLTLSVPLYEDPPGVLRVGKSRVLLELVIHAFQRGETPEGIVQSYDTLSLPDVYAVVDSDHMPKGQAIDRLLLAIQCLIRRRGQGGAGYLRSPERGRGVDPLRPSFPSRSVRALSRCWPAPPQPSSTSVRMYPHGFQYGAMLSRVLPPSISYFPSAVTRQGCSTYPALIARS